MIAVTTTDLQNNFGKYLQAVQLGDEIIVLKNGAEVARGQVTLLDVLVQAHADKYGQAFTQAEG